MPDLRLSGGARRPVRQLRQPARPDRPDRPALADRRLDAGVPRDEAPVPRPAAVRRPAARRGSRSHDDWRPNVRNFSLALLDEIRPRPITRDLDWGVRIPVPGYAEDENKRIYVWFDAVIGYLSASIEWAAATRRSGRLARVVAEPRVGALLLPGQGQHRLPHGDLAGDAARLRRGRRVRRRARPARAARQRRRDRVPDLRRQAVLDEPRPLDLRPRLPRPLRRRRAALLPRRGEPRDAGHRLHLGGVRPPQQRRAARELGQPRQPHAHERAPELRRRARAGRADRAGRGAPRDDRGRLRRGRGADRARPVPRRARRGDAALVRGQPVRERHGAVGARQDRPRPRRRPCSTSRSAPSTASR